MVFRRIQASAGFIPSDLKLERLVAGVKLKRRGTFRAASLGTNDPYRKGT